MASNLKKQCGTDLGRAFDQFIELLNSREGIMTEDNVRYFWLESMRQMDGDINCYTLEHPYPKEAYPPLAQPMRKELDLFYHKEALCFEIKFHQGAESTFAHTDAAGSLFNDIRRLKAITSIKERCFRGLFLYVTDGEMHKYLKGGDNKYRDALHKFYCMDQGQEEIIVFDAPKANDGAPKTFWESAFTSMDKAGMQNNSFQVKVRLLQGTPLPEQQGDSPQWHVRLYEVL